MRQAFTLSMYVSDALERYSDKHPNELVNPQLLSCFVLHEENKRVFYYPVMSVNTFTTEEKWGKNGIYTSYRTCVAINVDLYSYCHNPMGVKTKITGRDLLELEKKEGEGIDYSEWFCPQLNKKMIYDSEYVEERYIRGGKMVEEGVLLFKTWKS